MKILKNKKGFTLIELLAVIVVLAVIMMIATTQVMPLITDSRKSAFAVSSSTIVTEVMTLVVADEMRNPALVSSNLCYSVDYLIENEYVRNISSDQFTGVVLVQKTGTDGKYTYTLNLKDEVNGYYMIDQTYTKTLTADDISSDTTTKLNCSDYSGFTAK